MRLFLFNWTWLLASFVVVGGRNAQAASGRLAPEHILRYLPPGQEIAVQFNVNAIRDNEIFVEPLATIESSLNTEFQERQMAKVARVLGLRLSNVQSVIISGKMRDANKPVANSSFNFIWGIKFRKAVDLPSALRLGRTGAPEDEKPGTSIITEMINGKVVFYQEDRDLMIFQPQPKLVLIGGREVIKACTRIGDPSGNSGNEDLKGLLARCARNSYIKGALFPADWEEGNLLRFELTPGSPPDMSIVYTSQSSELRSAVLNRALTEWQRPAGPAVQKAFSGKWKGKVEGVDVRLSLPFSIEAAGHLLRVVTGGEEFIQRLWELPPTPTKTSSEPSNEN